jgi:hypothetical protein
MTFNNVMQYLNRNTLNPEQIRDVYDALRDNSRSAAAQSIGKFNRGDKVSFTGRYGQTLKGKITKLNHTTLSVVCTNGERWRVSANNVKKSR